MDSILNKVERMKLKLNEFCKVGNLENYRSTLQNIFDKIDESNCKISTREDGGPSVHEFPDISENCHIRIPLKQYSEKPLEAIWVILHEFGHHLSGSIRNNELTNKVIMEREELAWKYAREQAMCYKELIEHISDFDNYSERCLNNYREKIHKSKHEFESGGQIPRTH